MGKIIANPNLVTHVKITHSFEGIKHKLLGKLKLTYLPKEIKEGSNNSYYDEGYYDNGTYKSKIFYSEEDILNNNKLFIKDKKVYTKNTLKIYSGNVKLHTLYFESNIDLGYYLSDNLPNITLRF